MSVQSGPSESSDLAVRFNGQWESSDGTVPDVFEFLAKNTQATPQDQTRVLLADQFQRWQAGCELTVEQYFKRCADVLSDDRLRFGLILEELGYLAAL